MSWATLWLFLGLIKGVLITHILRPRGANLSADHVADFINSLDLRMKRVEKLERAVTVEQFNGLKGEVAKLRAQIKERPQQGGAGEIFPDAGIDLQSPEMRAIILSKIQERIQGREENATVWDRLGRGDQGSGSGDIAIPGASRPQQEQQHNRNDE